MSQQSIIGKHKTKVYREGSTTFVRYWYTDVVAFNDDAIVLDNGGYHTNTTKSRMNQASVQFNLGFHVFQKDYRWYVKFRGENVLFNRQKVKLFRHGSRVSEDYE